MVSFDALAAPFFAACLLLVASGQSKVRRPEPTARALSAAGLAAGRGTVRAIGAIEVGAGALGLVAPRPAVAVTVAVLYLVFAGFLGWMLLRQVPSESCGCAGARELPPSWLHATMDLIAAGIAVAVAVSAAAGDATGVFSFVASRPWTGAALIGGTLLIAWLAAQAVVYAPAAFTSYAGRIRT